ncbi:hypothetical protein H8S33_03250 [Ornithinibacillus sp. BX22]|uniref:Peptidyl-prolyl cis-trans isomerase n=2 Tax=Ornithinibacillus TaxID=484508 RepID=A0A923L3P5_9BACI|nr:MULTISPECIES: hypothetical protein [Ornithinibacillus]MBC5635836.1 hypothetical protein [Ornithinibacillus hominis]MBS3680175.1 hypothetical protein [Ornithinibacillus massiliensis]
MIVPIIGNVTYQITMDPTVWIFDDRKIILEEAFSNHEEKDERNDVQEAQERWERAVGFQSKPPVNRSLAKHERENILKYSYVMPIEDFLNHAEIKADAKEALLVTESKEIIISISDLYNSYLLFALDGKPLTENGPVHLLFKDGSNKDNPIKGITKIIVS